jgi:hypothetical protein
MDYKLLLKNYITNDDKGSQMLSPHLSNQHAIFSELIFQKMINTVILSDEKRTRKYKSLYRVYGDQESIRQPTGETLLLHSAGG